MPGSLLPFASSPPGACEVLMMMSTSLGFEMSQLFHGIIAMVSDYGSCRVYAETNSFEEVLTLLSVNDLGGAAPFIILRLVGSSVCCPSLSPRPGASGFGSGSCFLWLSRSWSP